MGFLDHQPRADLPLQARNKFTFQAARYPKGLTPSGITSQNVDHVLGDVPSDLKVIRSLHELHASESTRGYNACSTARLGTPRYKFPFRVCNSRVRLGGTPNAEIWEKMNRRSMTISWSSRDSYHPGC